MHAKECSSVLAGSFFRGGKADKKSETAGKQA
jgi:hypothetical protein